METIWSILLTKAISAALAGTLAAQPALAGWEPEVPDGWVSPFSDVAEGDWFYPFVAALNSLDVVHGYDDGRFGANDAARAGDAILMVLKAAGSGERPPAAGAHYASGYVDYGVKRGWLVEGQVPALAGQVSRLFVARLAAKALGVVPIQDATPFADVEDGSVTALYRLGILAGEERDGARLFLPDSPLTRAELSTIVWRVRQYMERTAGEQGYFSFGSYTLRQLEGVPAASWDNGAFRLKGDRMTYTGQGKASLGVDVSYHQGEIDWEKVAADGIEFAMIRAGGRYYGSGKVFEDKQFRRNLKGATDAGLDVGVYFFSQAITPQEGLEEARFLLKLLEDVQFDGPVVFDWENIDYDSARTDGVDAASVTGAANLFCQAVEQAGYQPMIYFNRYIAYLHYDLEEVVQYPFWIAEYGAAPNFVYDYQIWQYTDSGRVDGISGGVDMNIRLSR